MADFNKVILAGHLTRNPDVRNIQGKDMVVASCGIAVNRRYKDKQETMFIDFTAFGRLAETLGTYTTKGSNIIIEGRLNLNQWEQDGQKRSKHDIIVESIQLLDKKASDEQTKTDSKETSKAAKKTYTEEITEDDIPF